MSPPLRVGIVGLGAISRYYTSAMARLPSVRLAAVCDVRPDAVRPYPPAVPGWTDHRDMLIAAGLDAMVVAAPNDQHATLCRDALEAGVAVCVEKPLALRQAEAERLTALARARGTVLFTAFHRRYNASVGALRARLPRTAPVTSMRVRYLERIEDHIAGERWYLDPVRCGGGCVADNGPNAIDLVRLFLGEVSLVGARITRDAAGVDREATLVLAGAGGTEATVELDWSHPGECKDIELRLGGGELFAADLLAGFPGFKQSLWHEYEHVLADFARAVREGRQDGSGQAALALVEAAYRAERLPARR